MDNAQAVKAAEEELDRISYALECNPNVYNNAGLREIYQKKYEWLLPVVMLAKSALQDNYEKAVLEMTFKEKLMQEHPDAVGMRYVGGCRGCPEDYGYEPVGRFKNCEFKNDPIRRCAECWDRPIHGTEYETEMEISAKPNSAELLDRAEKAEKALDAVISDWSEE